MKLVQYLDLNDAQRLGVYVNDLVIDTRDLLESKNPTFSDMIGYFMSEQSAKEELANAVHNVSSSNLENVGKPLSELKVLPPVNPQKIFCIAMNYKSHIEEVRSKNPGFPTPSRPMFFSKLSNALIGYNVPILVPKVSTKVDYEIELAVIMGKKGKYIPASNALDYVAGYSVTNDVSFRDWQFPPQEMRPIFGQDWIRGKGLDSSLPLGPFMTSKDEVGDPQDLGIVLYLNGELRQKGSTSDMLFDVRKQIEWLSDGITLEPGDVICTGSCAHLPGDKFLKEGDRIVAKIDRVGELENPVVQEKIN